MSSRDHTTADQDSLFAGLNAEESYELLLSDPRKRVVSSSDTSVKKASSKHAELSSSWRYLWKTPSIMAALFVAALLVAIAHLVLFLVLNGKLADGPLSIPQNYVATVSHLLGLTFRSSLCSSLIIAFTQYLWYLMRIKAIKVSNIELLFKVTQDPFILARPGVAKVAPVLFVLASFTWILPIAITFPPGALTVVSKQGWGMQNTTVPTFNASFIGNGSLIDARSHTLVFIMDEGGIYVNGGNIPFINRVSRLVLETGDIVSSTSPCGPDCSYTVNFDGPYLRCTTEVYQHNATQDVSYEYPQKCEWNAFSLPTAESDGKFSIFRSSNFSGETLWQEYQNTSCKLIQASYAATFEYRDDKRAITYSVKNARDLDDPGGAAWMPGVQNGSCTPNSPDQCWETSPADWTQPLRIAFANFNYQALGTALFTPLKGEYTMNAYGDFLDSTEGSESAIVCGPENGTLIADTRFNLQRDSTDDVMAPEFSMTQDSLNDALFNITISASILKGWWIDTIDANATHNFNYYSFSESNQLILPYALCLLLSIPFLSLGLWSLRRNGVSATDGGFLQILTTTTRSKTLEDTAARCCLGGEEHVSKELENTMLRFGELVGSENEEGVVRAGFGTEEEIVPLKWGVAYGV